MASYDISDSDELTVTSQRKHMTEGEQEAKGAYEVL